MNTKKADAFTLDWDEMWDEKSEFDNYMWEAVSPYADEDSPFLFRIRQRLREGKIEFYDDSAPELREEGEDRYWFSLDEAKSAIQAEANDIAQSITEAIAAEQH